MELSRKSKTKPTLDSFLFATPEQKLIRFLLSESGNTFTPRVLSSRLKGVRGLGGAEGITRILKYLQEIDLVRFVNNNREVCVQNDNLAVQLMKVVTSVCDMEGLKGLLEPISDKGVLFGDRARGEFDSDAAYDLFVVSDSPDEVKRVVSGYPLGRRIELTLVAESESHQMENNQPGLAQSVSEGIVLWGSTW